MISTSLSHLADVLGGRLVVRGTDTPDTTVSGDVDTDSRLIEPGGIFVAKPGEATDGHLFVAAAVERGAALAIVERELDDAVSQIVVADAVAALSDLARDVVGRVRAGGDLRIVGITGSNGKTTTKNLLARILSDEGDTVSPRASFNNEVGAPLTMLRVTDDTRYLVSEFGASGPGAIAHLAGLVTPDIGVVLMVGMAHAGGFGGIESTFHAKSELVRATRPGGLAVLNADDPRVAAMEPIARERDLEVRWFGRGERAQVRAVDVEVSASGTRADLLVDGEPHTLTLHVLGEHHVMNALAALTAAIALGVSAADAIARLETVEIAERWRMQPLGSDRVRIINDAYNASPDSMAAALRTLAQITGPDERTVAVLGAMSELGEYADEEHDRVGLLAVRLRIQRIVIVGPEARRMFLEAIAQGSWDGEAVFFADADAAYDYLSTELRDGDRVLVKSSNSAGLRHLGDRLGDLFA
ncbi:MULTISPECIES: UDP-N-acetylmuramoyl-tripeptide--D-alanyl-D-alanine ligase [unclassified Microbacterium]|uniref:UDP-N-acetylmuramoyl-tripeptide--D-alanyl-D- alanine ligase n=1 Tax=unclassified Microbacterium TaxID=2609290 RepID=UPI0006F66FAB|nr:MULTISPECIES: UDP-N-acetylmuramoyl-tripeptide--D-alanyl-D-alanine ligase [unclassified Microbacterium]AOX44837.1 UDP-N-acetylmuramoylalanyl-D-glutamate--2,6-diaminopimelate ligase [Microbacterium sp. BH-3-3-3]KQT74596.1 UDP-N-acetylmuramoylalanyl-D-glutamate--2,6-diaminopimelate ligase [Microbacterium sp. Leaf436]MBD8207087.1 UDP-N-acetylmuramoyl-tripeptide--D-alanyl-D-alanine ligase [Microbacterium sp. CFBP 8801]MBD8218746.1 UDP-N-acetylmuramoyl-tripeptide--D-alanyl-D-alanine ligase [Microb